MEENKEAQENLQEKREQALWRLHEERTEEALWDCVVAFQEFEFHTYSGLPYSYHMKYGRSGTYTKELWINRREKSKSLVWSSVRSAYQKVLELQQESERPVVKTCMGGKFIFPAIFVLLSAEQFFLLLFPAFPAGQTRKRCRKYT